MESSRDPSPKIVTEIITENCGKSSPKIVTENHHRKQRAFSLPCQYHSGYWDYFRLTLDIFELFLISCLSPTPTFLTWHCKVEISFTPLAQYLCMITLDSALSLSGLRLAKKKCNYAIQVRRCFSKENAKHSFENALFIRCHFSRIPEVGLMSVARFSWVPNVYNLHFLLENHRPQPDPVNSYRDIIQVFML